MTATLERLDTPTGVLVGTFKPGSPEWHAARANGLGGSEIAAVLGLSKWESRFSLWHRKAGNIGPQPANPEMEAGTRLEPAICQKYADEHPEYHVLPAGTYRHKDRPWQVGNPDRLLYHVDLGVSEQPVGALEAKFALYDDEWGRAGTDEVPPYYLAQARWYLDTLGLAWIALQVFFGSSAEFREYHIEADVDDQALMREHARDFLDDVAAGVRPDIDAHSATYQAVRELHPDINGEDVEIPAELAAQYQEACAGLVDAKTAKQLAVSKVLDAMGNARRAVCAGQPIALRVANGDATPHLRPARTRKDKS